ncbi:phosphonate ABC transporter, permease protein PhnE [Paenibacillus polymyxa]|uniref:phosphonate ABC transporter, permease protein PhnE n=1 Tax=Paenibacillus TaxID=44249 RepID=UPI0008FC962F|nr:MULTISPECIES: phosphonate ABC transporter, permease protein PhnE [Paenibacillus]APB69559.1 phosphonate ABC transporter, permease protein PhnE [Paenibacillus polymyxa]QYK64129.1 Phosphate-import permease protein PhnE [Paenibacillus sp. S25]
MNDPTLRRPIGSRLRLWAIAILLIIIYIWAFRGMQFEGLQGTARSVSVAILDGFLHPDWSFVYIPEGEDLLRGLLDTLVISVLGTFVSAFVCLPFAFWASSNMTRLRTLSGSGKFVLSVIRVFPEMIVAILFIKAVGPGSFAGVLALGIHSIGMLAKLFSETIESVDHGPQEALIACGANRWQVIFFAVLPQVIPQFLSYSLYRFEINIRSATTLGLVGAGGIGTPLLFALQMRNWNRVGVILLGIVVLIILTDLISGWLRKRIV